MSDFDITVIVPIYNNAPFIEKCIDSLMRQSLEKIEYIFINDGSQDDSMPIAMGVVDNFPDRKLSVRTVSHIHNMGIAFTRQEGIDLAQGEYIVQCDSDDWVDPEYYEALYRVAKDNDADMVVANYKYECEDIAVVKGVGDYATWSDFKKSEYEQLSLCNRLIRRRLLNDNNIRLYEGVNFSEDYGLVFRCYYYSRKNVKMVGLAYYHYNRVNPNQTTHDLYNIRKLDQKAECLKQLSQFVIDKGENPYLIPTLIQEMRAVKEGYLLCVHPDYKKWRIAFPEITPIVLKDKRLNLKCHALWALGQYVSPLFMRFIYRR